MSSRQLSIIVGLLILISLLIFGLLLVQLQTNQHQNVITGITQTLPTVQLATELPSPTPTASIAIPTFIPSYTPLSITLSLPPGVVLPTKFSP